MVGNKTYRRRLRPPGTSFFLLGPRGTGKTMWAKANFPTATRTDLLDETRFQDLLAAPASFADELRGLEPGSWVVVDEVQRIPALLNQVHRLIEDAGLRFALLGSSARKLKAVGTNLLGGRALRMQVFPLVPAELGDDFDLDEVLRWGSIPLVWTSTDRRRTLESYVQLYLREEIRGEALVRNLPGFVRFLPVAALFHAQRVNISSIARDAGVARTTAAGYLDILEDTLLVARLPAYEARLRVRERKLPKVYWVDPGLVRAVKRQLGEPAAEERGSLLEGWVMTLLRTYAETGHLYDEISYWAPARGDTEVDFLLRRDREFVAIEVKASQSLSSPSLRGLRAIAELPGITRRIAVYTGTRVLKTEDGIDIWPAEHLATEIDRDRLWP